MAKLLVGCGVDLNNFKQSFKMRKGRSLALALLLATLAIYCMKDVRCVDNFVRKTDPS
jgi:hypothetical protein